MFRLVGGVVKRKYLLFERVLEELVFGYSKNVKGI